MKAIKEIEGGILLDIEVSPNASKFEISGYNSWRERLEIRIKAIPQKGKANKEIIKEMSKLTKMDVEIISGLKSHQKTLLINKISRDDFLNIIRV
ncbi:MAG: YggU family protein [Methanobacteriales archaeon HGW-Methanobacteriales-1]|jgi:hypothetical protein|uniref:DUF167 domain-containing protein n=1 Tax=Sulfuricurvum sp. TaxID=2025608 RepID=UPI000CBF4544|nr:DUF167 domain-containing protein [Sulfuricurvum sp.]MDO9056509.1 DUF167 domain-containing protein [Sulfuricurvum sp.]MDP2836387.1 DUF167 domain-containing protein [Methanobacteriaceae archaeon]PKL66520.1 MAG: YggU family protein [Methanobacteriales archaeon HGW-Methanobacteriales-1]